MLQLLLPSFSPAVCKHGRMERTADLQRHTPLCTRLFHSGCGCRVYRILLTGNNRLAGTIIISYRNDALCFRTDSFNNVSLSRPIAPLSWRRRWEQLPACTVLVLYNNSKMHPPESSHRKLPAPHTRPDLNLHSHADTESFFTQAHARIASSSASMAICVYLVIFMFSFSSKRRAFISIPLTFSARSIISFAHGKVFIKIFSHANVLRPLTGKNKRCFFHFICSFSLIIATLFR